MGHIVTKLGKLSTCGNGRHRDGIPIRSTRVGERGVEPKMLLICPSLGRTDAPVINHSWSLQSGRAWWISDLDSSQRGLGWKPSSYGFILYDLK